MLRFCFRLIPIEKLQNDGHLSWESLSDGWFWLDFDGKSLFRYPESQMDTWEAETSRRRPEYPVSRLWEQLLETLKFAMTEIPADISTHLVTVSKRLDFEKFASDSYDANPDVSHTAFDWWHGRNLVAVHPIWPDIRFLRVAKGIILCWNHLQDDFYSKIDNSKIERTKTIDLPFDELFDAISSFNSQLLVAMDERITMVPNREELQKVHDNRKTWLQNALDFPIKTDWDSVRIALAELKAEIT